MKRILRGFLAAWCAAGLASVFPALALVFPLEYHQLEATMNYQSVGGVPISLTAGTPAGSNGRLPLGNESTGVFVQPTPGQFRGMLSYGGIPGKSLANWQIVSNSALLKAGATAFSATVAQEMQLPMTPVGTPTVMILRRAQIGAPFMTRLVSFSFGSVIAPPRKDEFGILLPVSRAGNYWLPEPFTVNNHNGASYYWSPHARLAFAVQSGPIQVSWIGSTPYPLANKPTYTNPNGPVSFVTNGANAFVVYTENYVVSGGAIKEPRKMYWTQKGFQNIGIPVQVPAARVGAVNIVYNNNFPKSVTSEYSGVGDTSPTDGSSNPPLPELRTLWYDKQLGRLNAYNAEGRVFMELLGDLRPDGQTYTHLGFEIVDVSKQATPTDTQIELGERIVPPAGGSIDTLFPQPVTTGLNENFAFQHNTAGAAATEFYAVRETENLNDFLVHWLEEGVAGLRWPKLFGRYQLSWPTDAARYSHYVRPAASTEDEAAQTAVTLDPTNAPNIEYQDLLDRPRAKFTADFKFYTVLDEQYPAHRTLLRFISGERVAFERVFSWLDSALRTSTFVGSKVNPSASSIATNLTAWNSAAGRFDWPASFTLNLPRVVNSTAEVGSRISAPAETDLVDGPGYLAGHINPAIGTAYNIHAYKDPLTDGFAAANQGAIIPVNAIPGSNRLEVWWFRPNGATSGFNAGNARLGFSTINWPSVIAKYTLAWPASAREIVLASKLGGQNLTPAEAAGSIYYQNDPTLAGYNPNEEHAIMSGGTPFATRDDLNIITSTNNEYSSHPFVLLAYQGTDGRPSIAIFKVLREKPSAGYVFDYIVPAGQLVQPPPPLNFLAKPVEGSGSVAINFNTEPTSGTGDLPTGWKDSDAKGYFSHYRKFTYEDRKHNFWVFRGPHAGIPSLSIGTYNPTTRTFTDLTAARAVVNSQFSLSVHASRQSEYLSLSASGPATSWLSVNGMSLTGKPGPANVGTSILTLVVTDLYDQTSKTNTVSLTVDSTGAVTAQSALSIKSTNLYTGSVTTFTNRPPFLAESPSTNNTFTLQYYYRTEESFAWPGVASPPEVGSIVPYLRPQNPTNGAFIGDATNKDTKSLPIVYRPVWPVSDPSDSSKPLATLPYGATLTAPAFRLPGVRDFKTAHVLYQQSIAGDFVNKPLSAVLHDPTRSKIADLATDFPDAIPSGIKTENYQGKLFFPLLPPHLVNRVYIDPNRGKKGALTLVGVYKNEVVGRSYLQLNVLRGSDLTAVQELCPSADKVNYPKWTNLVAKLSTSVETFREDLPDHPGTYAPDRDLTKSVAVGDLAAVGNDNTAVDSYALSSTGPGQGYITLLEASGTAFTQSDTPIAMHVFKVGTTLDPGELKVITSPNPLSEMVTFQHTPDLAGRFDEYQYQWKIAAPVNGFRPALDATMSRFTTLTPIGNGINFYTFGGAGVQALSDNYVVMRYRPINPSHPLFKASPTDNDWSAWTAPVLAEGWIKRVLAGINPFNQRTTDLFNNQVNTDASILTQAGRRWEGDVALNIDTINKYGLIEIYETVLRRGRALSIEGGFNYGPANDALLLASGYLNDLYMMLGNEASADAANPTIGIGTANKTYGDIATSLFAFKGEVSSLLEEELALLRGRDDTLLPGVQTPPFYNRLIWNYTRGIDSGEVIYSMNYNITEDPSKDADGVLNASDAARMFPQGHGDSYGHYLTALKGYYSLLLNSNFDWVPRSESVNILGAPVTVDYFDERKFATAASAVARAGRQIFDLTWRRDYASVKQGGWSKFGTTTANTQRQYRSTAGTTNNPVRYWSMDHWATRTGQGAYLNWVVGNSLLPDIDPDLSHSGIQKVDRTTVPELAEITTTAAALQNSLDNAEGGVSPLGVPEDGLALDINPNVVTGPGEGSHFEQVFHRAEQALSNAVAAFDDAKDVTRLMRSEQDSLADAQNAISLQEQAYNVALTEIYGSPYPDDIGPGKTYAQGYSGPDMLHYGYVDLPEAVIPEVEIDPSQNQWSFDFYLNLGKDLKSTGVVMTNLVKVTYDVGPQGYLEKPKEWTSQRRSPGKLQQAISEEILANARLRFSITVSEGDMEDLRTAISRFESDKDTYNRVRAIEKSLISADEVLEKAKFANDMFDKYQESIKTDIKQTSTALAAGIPTSFIAGVASGGDLTSAARASILAAGFGITETLEKVELARYTIINALELAVDTARRQTTFNQIDPANHDQELRSVVGELQQRLADMADNLWTINERVREYDDKKRAVRALVAKGENIQAERETFRKRSAAIVQGYRTRDAAFRIFRNEKLERYKTLFDLAARYALLAANAYDYETGLLNTPTGRSFINRIISSRALGVVRNGAPQFAGSDTGDPGISSALAEMKADWDVLRGRLGFNNPDAYGTTVSLRSENFRILPGADGDVAWVDTLRRAQTDNILADPDIRRYCMQIDAGDGLAVPGIVLTFSTTIANGLNLFGQPLAAGDHAFSPSSFATKIFGVGAALEGYQGMDNPSANSGTVTAAGGTSATGADISFLDANAMSATPYIYLIPVGVDSMRSPPLGDTSTVRTWSVQDLAIPMPFNIGASGFSDKAFYQSSDSLTEALFALRKHQAFRPVSSPDFFSSDLYGSSGNLRRTQFTNNRLIGRSVWNSQWKLVIPGRTLLNNPYEGLDRFTRTVKDIKLNFVTYSYSGN